MAFVECHTRERDLGFEVFYTDTPGIEGKLKDTPEDFRVEEIPEFPPESSDGRFTIAKVTSNNWETNRLIRRLSRNLHISRNRIGFAGTKDKRAVTTQLMSFEAPLEEVMSLQIAGVEISDAYRARRKITIGDLVGNAFELRLVDCNVRAEELEKRIADTLAPLQELGGFPNYFGIQRFGSLRPVTHTVGKQIIHGDFEGAVRTYVASPTSWEMEGSRDARKRLHEEWDFESALRYFPQRLTFERVVIGHLVECPDDYSGALKRLPTNLQMMFVHAYQSYMFNRILSERIRREMPLASPMVGDVVLPMTKDWIPDHDSFVPVNEENIDLVSKQVSEGKAFVSGILFGSESEFAEGEMGELERSVVESEGVNRNDFIVPEIPHCNSKGSRRELICRFWDFSSSVDGDAATFRFNLGKGCYATSLLREFLKVDPIGH
jgi:tRNA pseudouridine13 synthase